MDSKQVINIIKSGETSKVQFKEKLDSIDSIVAEMIAMANTKGGMILFGINDKSGSVTGIDYKEIQTINNKLANAASDMIKPAIYIITEVVSLEGKNILIVLVEEGISKPYKNTQGTIWIKQGSDKRKLTDNHEQIRLFQKSGILYTDEMIVPLTSAKDLDYKKIRTYLEAVTKEPYEDDAINETVLLNMSVLRDNRLTLAGLLFFGLNPQAFRPAFCIKAVCYLGNSVGDSLYRDSRDITGTLPELFEKAMAYFDVNLHYRQPEPNFNTVGVLEISPVALEEVLQNALIHRDYSINASIRIMIFKNRVEIISPGSLPNYLSVESILLGNAVVRNNRLVSFCSKLMRYRGFGSGIIRAVQNQPNIIFFNDVVGEQFIVTIPRPPEP